MALEPLTITPEEASGDPPIRAMFNPERYTVSKSLQLAEIGIPGLDSPVVQYVRGQTEKINMELFFDTTDSGMSGPGVVDVRTKTTPIYKLLKVDGKLHAPPRVTLTWGSSGQLTSHDKLLDKHPLLVLESVSEEFSLFSPGGVPLRAKLTVTFREAWSINDQLSVSPRESADRTKVYRVNRGDTLSGVANSEYGDPTQWRAIADANALANPRLLEPGMVLTVPPLASSGQTANTRSA
jgi:LysM repeat protein